MFFRQFFDLGLYKSSCILFASLFFVSCNTVSNKPTEVVSAAGSRNIASASMASMNSSAFLVMQSCPVLSSIQTRIRAGTSNSQDIMEMMDKKDSQGKTLTQRLMTELTSSAGCFARVVALKRDMCSNNAYAEICEGLDQIEELGVDAVKKEFEEFAGTTADSLSPSVLASKLDEFVKSRGDDGGVVSSILNKINAVVSDHPAIVSVAGLLLIAFFGKAVLGMAASAAVGALAIGLKISAVVGVLAVAGWFVFRAR